MELSARLVEQLSLLALGVGRDGAGLVDDLTTLVSTLHEAVSGYAGLVLTVVHTGHPVRLSAVLPSRPGRPAVTSLRLPLPPTPGTAEDGGNLVVWSTVPGSLVDLAADVGYVLRTGDGPAWRGLPDAELDADLPPPTAGAGIDGFDELATIHRAAGLLIARGHEPGSVQVALRDQASAAGLSTHAWAARLLRLR